MKRRYYLSLCFAAVALLFSANSSAQIFGPASNGNDNNTASSSGNNQFNNNNWLSNPRKTAPRQNAATNTNPAGTAAVSATGSNTRTGTAAPAANTARNASPAASTKPNPDYMRQTKRPTLDGVVRGHLSMRPIYSEKEDELEQDRYIFVYLTNFNVTTTMSGRILCDVRFIVTSTLDTRINNISFRLKWPNMETAISFNDVTPNVETYTDYTLVGDGCYFMDGVPNVIVNRCRVRNMSQKECAEKIRWLRRAR